MTHDDPIVAEVRRAREELLARFDNDLGALVKFLQSCEREAVNPSAVQSAPTNRKAEVPPDKKVG
jgi:hypothetical protein